MFPPTRFEVLAHFLTERIEMSDLQSRSDVLLFDHPRHGGTWMVRDELLGIWRKATYGLLIFFLVGCQATSEKDPFGVSEIIASLALIVSIFSIALNRRMGKKTLEQAKDLQSKGAEKVDKDRCMVQCELARMSLLKTTDAYPARLPGMVTIHNPSTEWSNLRDAESNLRQAIKYDEENPEVHSLRGLHDMLVSRQRSGENPNLDRALEIDRNHADSLYYYGVHYLKQKEFEKAIEPFECAKNSVDNLLRTNALVGLGQAHVNLDSLQEAEDALREAHKHGENNPLVLYDLGWLVYKKLNDPNGALKFFEKANTQNPGDGGTLQYLAWCYFETERYEEARKALNEALVVDPKSRSLSTLGARLGFSVG